MVFVSSLCYCGYRSYAMLHMEVMDQYSLHLRKRMQSGFLRVQFYACLFLIRSWFSLLGYKSIHFHNLTGLIFKTVTMFGVRKLASWNVRLGIRSPPKTPSKSFFNFFFLLLSDDFWAWPFWVYKLPQYKYWQRVKRQPFHLLLTNCEARFVHIGW